MYFLKQHNDIAFIGLIKVVMTGKNIHTARFVCAAGEPVPALYKKKETCPFGIGMVAGGNDS